MTLSFKNVILTVFIFNQCNLIFGLPGIGDIQTIANFANDALGVLKGDLPLSALLTGSTGVMLDRIMEAVEGITSQIDDLGNKMTQQMEENAKKMDQRFNEVSEKLDEVLVLIPLEGKVYDQMQKLHDYVLRVDSLYEKFEKYSKALDSFNNFTIGKFIDAVVSDRQGDLSDVLTKIFRLLIPIDSDKLAKSIFEILSDQIQEGGKILCGGKMSPQLRLFQIYEYTVMTETRGFIMSIFAYSVLAVVNRSPFDNELNGLRDQLVSRSKTYLSITVQNMKPLPRNLEHCDAPTYRAGFEFERLASLNSKSVDFRTMSLMPQYADINNSMVVTGVRFVRDESRMIRYQIREGRIGPQGLIDNRYGGWVPLQPLKYVVDSSDSGYWIWSGRAKIERDFVTLSETEKRINLDDIKLPTGYLVGGIGFDKQEKAINVKVYAVKFNFNTGKLDPANTKWMSLRDLTNTGEAYSKPRAIKSDGGKGTPPLARNNKVDSESNEQYVFNYTNADTGTEYLVPFFDIRPVVRQGSRVAISGISLFHRGTPDYGGYLNFRLYTLDMTEYINLKI